MITPGSSIQIKPGPVRDAAQEAVDLTAATVFFSFLGAVFLAIGAFSVLMLPDGSRKDDDG